LRAFFTLASTCSFQVSHASRITLRNFIDLERRKVTPNSCGSKNPGSFLIRVKATSPVLSGLTDSSCPLHHTSTECRAHCMSLDTVGELIHRWKTCCPHVLECKSPCHWAQLSVCLQLGTKEVVTICLPVGNL
jgi:hypothetical protein